MVVLEEEEILCRFWFSTNWIQRLIIVVTQYVTFLGSERVKCWDRQTLVVAMDMTNNSILLEDNYNHICMDYHNLPNKIW